MKNFVRIIDEEGLFIEDAFVEELTKYTIETPCPAGFYHPKWDSEKEEWVEGGTKPEPQPKEETLDERIELLQEAVDFMLWNY